MEEAEAPFYSRAIREIDEDSRPRERLLKHGAEVLSDAELVALVLGSGLRGENVLDISRAVLDNVGGLGGLVRATPSALKRLRGLGPAKAAQLAAAVELGRRAQLLDRHDRPMLRTPEQVFAYLGSRLAKRTKEEFYVLALDTRGRLLGAEAAFKGTIETVRPRPAEAFREAVLQDAASVIFVHNHPSGDPSPSANDVRTTKTLIAAGELLEIEVIDHVIIGQGRFCSLKREGYAFGNP